MTAVMTGVRLGELRALRWGDVEWDRDQPRLHVRRSVTESGVFQKPKTARSVRRIAIGPSLLAALRARGAHAQPVQERRRSDVPELDRSRAGWPQHVQPALPPDAEEGRAAQDPLSRFRHTCASLLLQAGVPVTVVSKMLGHASAKMTLDVYAHVMPEALDEAADTMEAVLLRADAKAVEQA